MGRVVVVLVEPQHPGNVGAAARAMKNFGLDELVLVAPAAFDPHRARWMAPGCDDVLARARIVRTLDDALAGVTRAIATTARHRRGDQRVLGPDEVGASVAEAPEDEVTAILFGREDHGLDAASVARCEALLRIPTPEHASLNLGQAVMLVAWVLWQQRLARGEVAPGRVVGGSRGDKATADLVRRDPPADVLAMEPVVAEAVEILARVGYTGSASPEKIATTLRGLLQRARPSAREVSALRGMLRRVAGGLVPPGEAR